MKETITELKYRETAESMLDFIHRSPSCFHAIKNLSESLISNGFTELKEDEEWNLKTGKCYFTKRNSSSIISFKIPETENFRGFSITASHSDSPSFKIKENEEMPSGGYITLNVEKYGGMLCAPWFDRPLSVAGRIVCAGKDSDGEITLTQKLVDVNKDLLIIPNLAIHMNRNANDGQKYNVQQDLLPIYAEASSGKKFMDIIAESAGVQKQDILSTDLFLYNRVKGTFWGANEEFIAASQLDDLECAWTTFQAFLESENDSNCTVHCVFDNEEVGSQTKQGAASTFLKDTLHRINASLGKSDEQYYKALAQSFMVSADNAHAVHPNYASVADPVNRPAVNKGPVIKFNAAQKYTTDAFSAALFKQVCKNAEVPYQTFTNRSDMAGGSTLGNISGTQVSIPCVDIGLAQWAMHSPYESAGAKDPALMVQAIREFYKATWNFTTEN
ncbi:MAG: M18 family aminopeptidase [Treponema sp.]|nr:M18 family aminopeptidase [Treponema sp.]